MMHERKLVLQPIPGRVGMNVYIYTENPDGSADVLKDNLMTRVGPGEPMEPTFYMEDLSILQLFVDEAAKRGIKHQGGFTEGKLEATEKHLEDMRKLVMERENRI